MFGILLSDIDVFQIAENSENIQKPDDNNNYSNGIQDTFDFPVHRDIIIDEV
jgi:hypothetical protein